MECPECRQMLQRKLDGEPVVQTAELARHLHDCAACKELDAAGEHLLAGLRALPVPEIPEDFSRRMTVRVLDDRLARRRRLRVRMLITGALAACLMLMALAANMFGPRAGDRHEPAPMASPNPL